MTTGVYRFNLSGIANEQIQSLHSAYLIKTRESKQTPPPIKDACIVHQFLASFVSKYMYATQILCSYVRVQLRGGHQVARVSYATGVNMVNAFYVLVGCSTDTDLPYPTSQRSGSINPTNQQFKTSCKKIWY